MSKIHGIIPMLSTVLLVWLATSQAPPREVLSLAVIPAGEYVEPNGAALRATRLKRGMTQRDLAEVVHVSHGYLAMLETGARNRARRTVMTRVAHALNVELSAVTN